MPSIGKVTGLCADYSVSTLNGRPYDKIYERILSGKDTRFNAMMKRGGIPCELGHPTDFDVEGNPRTETDPTKVAVILKEIKRTGPKQLTASGEIMDTPNGRIYKALAEYYDFGLSSRGSYEISEDNFNFNAEGPDGWNQDSYVFKGYDLVLLPANANSFVSATEGISSCNKKIIKVARESIDTDLLSKASQVSKDQVEEALDQLFKIDKESKKGEEVPISEMKDILYSDDSVSNDIPEDGDKDKDEIESEEVGQEEEIKPDLITDGDELEKIKGDLQKALDEIQTLTEGREKDSLELSSRDAKIAELVSDNENLSIELDEKVVEAENLVEKLDALKELASKLIENYKAAKSEFDSKSNSTSERESELEEELNESKKETKAAKESLEGERRINRTLRKELGVAKEALIGSYSLAYGVSTEAVKATLGKSYSVNRIKPAVESLANQTTRLASTRTSSVVLKRSSATESFIPGDDIEREIYDLLKNQ